MANSPFAKILGPGFTTPAVGVGVFRYTPVFTGPTLSAFPSISKFVGKALNPLSTVTGAQIGRETCCSSDLPGSWRGCVQIHSRLHGTNLVGVSFHLEVRGEGAESVIYSYREAAGPSEKARHLPSANDRV